MKPVLVAILGPTATGKSALALAVAERYDGEIINCDSTAVYRGFDIGTDKLPMVQRRGIPHHLINEEADVAHIRPAIEHAYAASQPVALLIGRRPSTS